MSAIPTNPSPLKSENSNLKSPLPSPLSPDSSSLESEFPRLATDPPRLDPTSLFPLLEEGITSIQELKSRLHCSAAELRESLASQEAHELLELQTSLCAMRLKLLALKAAPEAFQVLVKQMSSDKPEVCRRSAIHNLSLAGIPTSPFPARPARPLLKKPAPPKDPQEIFNRVIAILPLSPKQQKELQRLDYDPVNYDYILNRDQRKLYESALKGNRLPIPPLKSQISTPNSPDPTPAASSKSEISNLKASLPTPTPNPPRAA